MAQGKEDDEEDGVVNQRPPPRKRRAHSGGRGRGERIGARRMAPPTPEERGQVRERPVPAEENGRKRDAGEDPVKRSRSQIEIREISPPNSNFHKSLASNRISPPKLLCFFREIRGLGWDRVYF
ncbi:hypothetical protein ACS0TY_013243 [Phlomoides rotata]